jgi:hypothetical protein
VHDREAAALDLAGGRFEVGTPAMVLDVGAAVSSVTFDVTPCA